MVDKNSSSLDLNMDSMNLSDFSFIQKNTNLNMESIKEFYKNFLKKYNNGYVNREQFNNVIKHLIVNV